MARAMVLARSLLLGFAPFIAEVLALAPPSGYRLIHAVVELVHANLDAVHTVMDVDILVSPTAMLGGPL